MVEPGVRLRVLIVADLSPLGPGGGGERVLLEHARGLARRGHDVRVLARAPDGSAPPATVVDGVRVRHVPAARGSMRAFARAATAGARWATDTWLAEESADVLAIHQPLAGWGALTAPRARALPALYTFLSPAPLEYRSRRRMTGRHRGGPGGAASVVALWLLERACLQRAARIQVLSDYSADQLWRLYAIADDRVVRIPGGVDVTRFRPIDERATVRAALGLPADRPVLLTVRNLEARMGLDTLLRAMARVRHEIPDALLVVGGIGSRRDELLALGGALGLDGTVRFVGWIGDDALPRWYQAADAFVLPTRELEGFGLVTVEALATGTPVIATAVGASPEILEPLDPSLLVPRDDPEALARRLAAFLAARDSAATRRLRAACRDYAARRYTWDRAVGGVEAELVALARGGTPATVAPACPACGAPMQHGTIAYRGRRYLRCARCGTRAMARPPSADETRHRYDVGYPRRFGATPRAALLASLAARLGTAPAGGRLLDAGCGGGDLAREATARGWRVAAGDLAREACAAARDAGARAAQCDVAALPFRAASHDVVAFVNVLDHTPRPFAVLAEARRALRPGGRVIVRVPNGAVHAVAAALLARLGPLARLAGWDRRPILHLVAFGACGLRRALERAGFDVERMGNSPPAAPGAARALPRAIAAAVAALSRGRWIVGPSLEAWARRGNEPS